MTKVKVNPGRETLSELRRRKSLADEDLVIEGALPNIPGDEPNKLPKVLQGSERNVVFNNIVWPGSTTPNRNVRVQLAINGTKYGDVLNLRTPITYPQTLKLPADETRYERVFTLSYFVSYGSSSAPSEVENGRTQVYVDKSPPHHGTSGEAMKHPPEIVNGVINKSLLEAQEEFTFKVDLPTDKKSGDSIKVFYGSSIPGTFIREVFIGGVGDQEVEFKLHRGDIYSHDEGSRILYYQWRDRVGNEGPFSDPSHLQIQINPIPENLPPLRIPEADDGSVNYIDANTHVSVVLETYDNPMFGVDELMVTWDNLLQVPQLITAFPVIVEVPFSAVASTGLGPKTSEVSYYIVRRFNSYPAPQKTSVAVDLRKPGPESPDEPNIPIDPGIGNPELPAVIVRGGASTVENEIINIDRGQDVTATAPIYTGVKAGDVVQLYWNNIPVPGLGRGVLHMLGNETALNFLIDWDLVEATGNDPEVKVQYRITHPNTGDNFNPSLVQNVDVYINVVALPVPKFARATFDNDFGVWFVTCCELELMPGAGGYGMKVSVPGSTELKAGDMLTFKYEGRRWDNDSGNYVPRPSLPFTVPRQITQAEARDGFDLFIPYAAAFEETHDGQATVSYSVMINGRVEMSDKFETEVVMVWADGKACFAPGSINTCK